MRHLLALAADEHALERRTIVQMLENPLQPFAVDDRDLRSGIFEPVFELRAGPPGVEQGRHAADQETAEEGRRPFRHIAHGDGDAVAFLHPRLLQRLGDRQRRAGEVLVTRPLVAIDDKGPIAVAPSEHKYFAHGRRRVLPHARAHAANVALFDLERRARSGQRRIGLCQRDGRESRSSRHVSSSTHSAVDAAFSRSGSIVL